MSTIESRGYIHPEVLVSTDWVAQHLNDPKVRIVESNEDTLLYPPGTSPAPSQVDWTADLNDPLRRDYLTREGFEALMSPHRRHEGHDRRLLRRQEQLVGDLRLLGVPALRPHQREGHGRRPPEVGEGRAPADPRRAGLPGDAATRRRSATTRPSAPSATRCCGTSRSSGQMVDVRSPEEYTRRAHCTCPTTRTRARCAAATSRAPKNVPWARAINPDDGTFKTAEELQRHL